MPRSRTAMTLCNPGLGKKILALSITTILLISLNTSAQEAPGQNTEQQLQPVAGFSAQSRLMSIDVLEPPRASGGTARNKLIDPTTWAQIEVIIEAMPEDLIARLDYIDKLEVRIHWLTPEPNRNDADFDQRQVFSLSQTFSHIKPSRQVAFLAFIPPTWVERFGGGSRVRSGSNVAVQVFYQDRLVIETEMRERGTRAGDDPDWFKQGGKAGVLLPITQTPWMNDFWDRYYRPERSSQN